MSLERRLFQGTAFVWEWPQEPFGSLNCTIMGGCHGAGDPREEIRKAFFPALCCTLSPGLQSRITWVQNLITFSSVHPNIFLPLCPRRLPIRLVVGRRAVGRMEGYCTIPSIPPSSSAPLIYTTTATLLTPQCLLQLKLQPL